MPPPPPRPNRPVPPRPSTAKVAPPPPAPGTVKPSTRIAAAKAPAPAPRTPPPPPSAAKAETEIAPAPTPAKVQPKAPAPPAKASVKGPAKPITGRAGRGRPAAVETDQDEDEGAPVRARPRPNNRKLILIVAGLGVALIGILVLAAAWGPMQRSSQLAALDACRSPERIEEAIRLAQAFSVKWGERSEHVANAIATGRGPVEARIQMCRDGKFLKLLAQILGDEKLTPAQRGMVCAALSELWPHDGSGPGVSPGLAAWALNSDSPPELSTPALRLLVAMSTPDAETNLSRAAADGKLPPERAVAIAVALGHVLEKRNLGVKPLLTALAGAHRAPLLASPAVAECVRMNAQPADAAALLALLDKPDSVAIGLAGLGGRNFVLGEGDAKARAELTAQLVPFLAPDKDDAVLAGALLVVHRQRLIGARAQVIALLPRLAKRRPEQLPKEDLADLLGKSLISSKSPEAATAAEEMVAALTEALDSVATRNLAIVALSRVQDPNVAALRPALDGLAGFGDDGAAALDILVTKVYGREDIAKAGRSRGWSATLAEDRRKRARYDAIVRWMAEHGAENNARVDPAVMAANKAELGRMRDEIRGWSESKDPLPLGVTRSALDSLANKVQILLNMVIKGTTTGS